MLKKQAMTLKDLEAKVSEIRKSVPWIKEVKRVSNQYPDKE